MKKIIALFLILSVPVSYGANKIARDKNFFVNMNRKLDRAIASQFGYYEFQKELRVDYSINKENEVKNLIDKVSTDHMNQLITKISSYPTRNYLTASGIEAFDWIANYWQSLVSSRSDISLTRIKHDNFDQRSIILEIKGQDANLNDQIILIGAHGDSINTNSTDIHAVAPGADDNAAGVAVVSELIRIIVDNNYRPKRSLHFVIYAAEEYNMLGSYDIAKRYRESKQKVIGVLNLDGVNDKQNNEYDLVLIDDSTDKEQNIFLGNLIDTYLQKKWTWQTCGYGCSDHAAWTYEGYRASSPFEGLLASENPYIHTEEDTFEKANFSSDHAAIFAKLALSYLVELDK